jgi:hypothetical protein
VPTPDKPSGTPASPTNLPAGFGGFRRKRQAKKDDD